MKLREWFQTHHFLTVIFLFIILSLSVGVMYLGFFELFSMYDVLIGIGMSSIGISLLSYGIRFIIASLALFIITPFSFYQKPRNLVEYTQELSLVRGSSWGKTILCGLVSFLIFMIVALGLALGLGIFPENPFVFFENPGEDSAGWLMLIAAVNPGFFEEIGFRGVLYSNLEKKYKGWVSVLISAVFFGLFHFGSLTIGEDPVTVIFLVIMATSYGLAWGYMRLKTKSVIPSMIVHYLIDALSEGFLNPNTTDQTQFGIFMVGLIVLYPILSIVATKLMFLSRDHQIRAKK